MFICLCNGFTDRQVRCTAEAGASSVAQVYSGLACTPKCGKCVPVVRDLLRGIAPPTLAQSPAYGIQDAV